MTTEIEDHTGHRIHGIDAIIRFAMGGRAIFTVRNSETGNRVTYRIDKVKDSDEYTVSAFTGSDNSSKSNYTALGTIENGVYHHRGLRAAALNLIELAKENNDTWLVSFATNMAKHLTNGRDLTERQATCLERNLRKVGVKTSKLAADDMKVKVFVWLFNRHLSTAKELPEKVEFWHEGRCGDCGRRLTVPESIARGIGPICWDGTTVKSVIAA